MVAIIFVVVVNLRFLLMSDMRAHKQHTRQAKQVRCIKINKINEKPTHRESVEIASLETRLTEAGNSNGNIFSPTPNLERGKGKQLYPGS